MSIHIPILLTSAVMQYYPPSTFIVALIGGKYFSPVNNLAQVLRHPYHPAELFRQIRALTCIKLGSNLSSARLFVIGWR